MNIEPSAVEEVSQEHNGVSEVSLNNSSLDGKIVSTEVGSGILPIEEESAKLRISNVTESKFHCECNHLNNIVEPVNVYLK